MPRTRRPRWLAPRIVVGLVAAVVAGLVWFTRRPPVENPGDVQFARFTDVTAAAGIHFRHVSGAAGRKLLPETMGGGVAVLDFDRDGRPDLFFVNSRRWPGDPAPPAGRPTPALYRNRGDGTFEDVTTAAGLDVELYGMGVAAADYDNDGWPDLFVSAVWGDRLFRNVGSGAGRRFEDVTARAWVGGPGGWPDVSADAFLRWDKPVAFPASAAWLDYDADGRLDLFVCRYLTWSPAADLGVQAVLPGGIRAYVPPNQFTGAYSSLFRNRGDGTFEDVSAAAGVQVADGLPGRDPTPVGKSLGVVVCDPDGDGWPDVVVANDTVRNFFFHNIPDARGGRRYEEIGLLSNVAYADGRPRGGMGIDAAELLPGLFAVLIANFSNEPDTLLKRVRLTPPMFADVALSTGLAGPTRSPMKFGAMFFDYDLDGRPDLFTCDGHLEPDIAAAQHGQTYPQPAQLFRNTGEADRLFAPVTAADAGPDLFRPIVGRGCAYLDYDGDGDPDVVLCENNGPARLLRNDSPPGRKWIRFVLEGDGRTVNRGGVGAEVTVEAGGVVLRRYVTTAHGYLSQSDLGVTVGLGTAVTVDRVAVRWPSRAGKTQEWRDLAAGATYRLTFGDVTARPILPKP